jgi:flavin-dependent dehydrogenase
MLLGRHAIVVGAGIGGLTAAKALSSHFGDVTVLERDALPTAPIVRAEGPFSKAGTRLPYPMNPRITFNS